MGNRSLTETKHGGPRVGKVTAPLNAQLKNVEWGEFRIGDLFKIQHYGKQRSKEDLQKGGLLEYNFVMQNENNNGVIEKVPEQIGNHFNLIPGNSISAFTHLNKVYYQEEPFYSKQGSNVYTLRSKFLNKQVAKFIVSAINTSIGDIEYGKNTASRLENYKIFLPIEKEEIDFEFMESFVQVIENQRFEELKISFKNNGLDNYEFTLKEKEVLENFEKINWSEFRMSDLFDRVKTKKLPYKAKDLPSEKIEEFNLPCLTSSFNNQGLNYYAPRDGATVLKNVISIPSNSDVYRAYFQSNEFTVLSDAYAMQWILDEVKLLPNQYLFTVQCINKVTDLSIYSYKNKLGGWNVVKNKHIQLPIKNDKPDYEIMDTLISAIKKMAIKDVVLYLEEKMN